MPPGVLAFDDMKCNEASDDPPSPHALEPFCSSTV